MRPSAGTEATISQPWPRAASSARSNGPRGRIGERDRAQVGIGLVLLGRDLGAAVFDGIARIVPPLDHGDEGRRVVGVRTDVVDRRHRLAPSAGT
jgi:hypothetical protein